MPKDHQHGKYVEARKQVQESRGINLWFGRMATKTAHAVGSPWAFVGATAVVVLWAIAGPMFGFSDTWQLIINTGTTICTFLIVFLIQNTQNRDAKALHLKLDEVIRSIQRAHNDMIDIEHLSDKELEHLEKRYEQLRDEESGIKPREPVKRKKNKVA
jgi:low affinity Fe/Cu permease